jgi:hypothetical protein
MQFQFRLTSPGEIPVLRLPETLLAAAQFARAAVNEQTVGIVRACHKYLTLIVG